jgi:two-component system chemotaxis response regulator CheB
VKQPWAGPGAPLPAVVVVGTSLGGLHALEAVLGELTADFPLPIAVVQHRSIEAPDSLSLLLQLHCVLPVSEANDKEPMVGGHVYLAPADYHLLIDDGRFALSTDPATAEAPLMPRAAITAGNVDEVLPLAQLGAYLNTVTMAYR